MHEKNLSHWPAFSEEESNAVSRVLLSNHVNYWTGCEGRAFEREFAAWCGCEYAVAVANGTLALEAALAAIDIGKGDEVIVTPRTFIASVSAIVMRGATPVFADVDACSQTIDPGSVRKLITSNTRAIICVHLAGWPCEMNALMDIAQEKSIYVIEDCAQAHGAKYRGRSVGSIGHISAWSFCQDKIMTTGGEGGMVTTNDPVLWERVWSYKDHGKTIDAIKKTGQASVGYKWLHDSFGTNMRMTEMQAAIGRIQIKRMAEWHKKRIENAAILTGTCSSFPSLLRVPELPTYIEHAWYKYYVFVREEGLATGWSRNRIVEEIVSRGVPCFTGICPEVYLEHAFDEKEWRPKVRLPVAKKLGDDSLMFLVHPTLTTDEIENMCGIISSVMMAAVK